MKQINKLIANNHGFNQTFASNVHNPSENPSLESVVEMAQVVFESLLEGKTFNSKKIFTRGINDFKRHSLYSEVWVTKAYLGNVATLLGATNATLALIVGIGALILQNVSATFVAATISGTIGLFLMPWLGASYGAATTYIMNKTNSYEIGSYFYFDHTFLATPLTAMATLRSQNDSETRKIVQEFPKDFMEVRTEDVTKFQDDWHASINLKWPTSPNQNSKKLVIDLSQYLSRACYRKISKVDAKINFNNGTGVTNEIRGELLNTFLARYLQDCENSYLYILIEKFGSEYNVYIGGTKYQDYSESQVNWFKGEVGINNTISGLAPNQVTFALNLDFEA